MNLTLVATCMFGLEKQLGEEIDALGLRRLETIDGRVTFEGTERDVPRANICLRCAERVFIRVGAFPASTFTELFDGTRALPWEEWIGRTDAFPVKGHSIRSTLTSLPDCQSIIKKAVVERLHEKYGISWFEETGMKYQIEFFLFKDTASLMIDTSGTALHKRGYRPEAGAAPLRETLAAAIALTARPREDILFWDPFCGSGTIAIEAAMIATNRAPGLGRSFDGERFPNIPTALWQDARAAAEAAVIRDSHFEAYASDIDEDILDLTYENAVRAGVEEYLNIFQADARSIKRLDRRGTVVCNPPYGERMGEMSEIEALYRALGPVFHELYPWQIYVLTSCDHFDRLYGQPADRVKRLFNGMLPCFLYEYYKPADARDARAKYFDASSFRTSDAPAARSDDKRGAIDSNARSYNRFGAPDADRRPDPRANGRPGPYRPDGGPARPTGDRPGRRPGDTRQARPAAPGQTNRRPYERPADGQGPRRPQQRSDDRKKKDGE